MKKPDRRSPLAKARDKWMRRARAGMIEVSELERTCDVLLTCSDLSNFQTIVAKMAERELERLKALRNEHTS